MKTLFKFKKIIFFGLFLISLIFTILYFKNFVLHYELFYYYYTILHDLHIPVTYTLSSFSQNFQGYLMYFFIISMNILLLSITIFYLRYFFDNDIDFKNINFKETFIAHLLGLFFLSFLYFSLQYEFNKEIPLKNYSLLTKEFKSNKFLRNYYQKNFEEAIPISYRQFFYLIRINTEHNFEIKNKKEQTKKIKEKEKTFKELIKIYNEEK